MKLAKEKEQGKVEEEVGELPEIMLQVFDYFFYVCHCSDAPASPVCMCVFAIHCNRNDFGLRFPKRMK